MLKIRGKTGIYYTQKLIKMDNVFINYEICVTKDRDGQIIYINCFVSLNFWISMQKSILSAYWLIKKLRQTTGISG